MPVMLESDFAALRLTLLLSGLTTLILLMICLPLAYRLASSNSVFKPWIETLVTLPLVLPPTVLGYYLLIAFSPNNGLAQWLQDALGLSMAFSFEGILVASIIYSLPFTFRPLQSAFEQLPPMLRHNAAILGFSPTAQFSKVILPAVKPAIFTAVTLSFAHTVGEFGMILMIGGNIPGQTQVLSLALFEHVESLDFAAADRLALIMLGFSFVVVLSCQWWQRRWQLCSGVNYG